MATLEHPGGWLLEVGGEQVGPLVNVVLQGQQTTYPNAAEDIEHARTHVDGVDLVARVDAGAGKARLGGMWAAKEHLQRSTCPAQALQGVAALASQEHRIGLSHQAPPLCREQGSSSL